MDLHPAPPAWHARQLVPGGAPRELLPPARREARGPLRHPLPRHLAAAPRLRLPRRHDGPGHRRRPAGGAPGAHPAALRRLQHPVPLPTPQGQGGGQLHLARRRRRNGALPDRPLLPRRPVALQRLLGTVGARGPAGRLPALGAAGLSHAHGERLGVPSIRRIRVQHPHERSVDLQLDHHPLDPRRPVRARPVPPELHRRHPPAARRLGLRRLAERVRGAHPLQRARRAGGPRLRAGDHPPAPQTGPRLGRLQGPRGRPARPAQPAAVRAAVAARAPRLGALPAPRRDAGPRRQSRAEGGPAHGAGDPPRGGGRRHVAVAAGQLRQELQRPRGLRLRPLLLLRRVLRARLLQHQLPRRLLLHGRNRPHAGVHALLLRPLGARRQPVVRAQGAQGALRPRQRGGVPRHLRRVRVLPVPPALPHRGLLSQGLPRRLQRQRLLFR
mmetsp:Transcript_12502/g.48037  ORF Transcript_12502/g.48037 Transcript_12502/m.48037 type:complete len:442 (+) Transcript_12502:967-2292(+)